MAKRKVAHSVKHAALGVVDEFTKFLKTYGIIGLAIGFVMGAAVKDYVNVIVNDLINPLIGLLLPNLTSLAEWKVGAFGIGNFLTATINLLILAMVIFVFIRYMLKKETEKI